MHGISALSRLIAHHDRHGDRHHDGDQNANDHANMIAGPRHLCVIANLQCVRHRRGDERLDIQEHNRVVDHQRREQMGGRHLRVETEDMANEMERRRPRLEAQNTAFRDGSHKTDRDDDDDRVAADRVDEIDVHDIPEDEDQQGGTT